MNLKKIVNKSMAVILGIGMLLGSTPFKLNAAPLQQGQTDELIWDKPGAINLSKKYIEADTTKNEWEMKLSIEGKNKNSTQKTDVVLVLDCSASMKQSVGTQLTCGKQAHSHYYNQCQKYWKSRHEWAWACGLNEHTHSNKCYSQVTRADKVQFAANTFVDQLLANNENNNIDIGITSFHGKSNGSPTGVEVVGLTNDKQILKSGVKTALTNLNYDQYSGGTNYSDGFNIARAALGNQNKNNKIIVFLSDGEPTFPGAGNKMSHDSIEAAIQAKDAVSKDIEIYTIGAGVKSDTRHVYRYDREWYDCGRDYEGQYYDGKWRNCNYKGYSASTILEKCASKPENYFLAEDAGNALEDIMRSIAREIAYGAENAYVIDPMGDAFNLLRENGAQAPSWEVNAQSDADKTVRNKDIMISQGDIQYDSAKKTIRWNIGKIAEGQPATMQYRIKMKSDITNSEITYPTNGVTTLFYKDANGRQTSKEFDVPKVSARKGNIKIVYYTVDKVNGQWVPVNRDGVPIKEGRPDLAYEIKKGYWKDNEALDLGKYSITLEHQYEKEGIVYEPVEELIPEANKEITLTTSEANRTLYYPYHPTSNTLECECSTVLAEFIKRIKDKDETALTNALIKQEIISAIVDKINSGNTVFEKKLAEYELRMLLDQYGNVSIGTANHKTYNQLLQKHEKTELGTYITLSSKTQLGTVGVREILTKLGLNVSTKSLESIYEQLNHKHQSVVIGGGVAAEKDKQFLAMVKQLTGKDLASFKNQPIQMNISLNSGGSDKKCDITLKIGTTKLEYPSKDYEQVYRLLGTDIKNHASKGQIKQLLKEYDFIASPKNNFSKTLKNTDTCITKDPRPCEIEKICGKLPEGVKDGKVPYENMSLQVKEGIVSECVCRYEHLKETVKDTVILEILPKEDGNIVNYIMADGLSCLSFKFNYQADHNNALNLNIGIQPTAIKLKDEKTILPKFNIHSVETQITKIGGTPIKSPNVECEVNNNEINLKYAFDEVALQPNETYDVKVYFKTQLKDTDYNDYCEYMALSKDHKDMTVQLSDLDGKCERVSKTFNIIYKSLKVIH
ncbi:MAG: VWA domain-containing protein [Cellulosilyticaceae bacterium]